jgi:hypothetical protein
MKTNKIILILVLIGLFQFTYDYGTNENFKNCLKNIDSITKNKLLIQLLFHHIFISFLQYSWIVDNKSILIARLLTTIFMYFYTFKGNDPCPITKKINQICNNDDKFRDLLFISGCKDNENQFRQTEFLYYFITNIYILFKLFVK